MIKYLPAALSALALLVAPLSAAAEEPATEKLRVLIIDGQNNHRVWPKSTIMMRQYLEETDLFTVDVARTAFTWRGDREAAWLPLANVGETQATQEPQSDPAFAPDFTQYDVVVSNLGWKAAPWPEATKTAFEAFVANGGGFVAVHAADNAFPEWEAYNRMIGLGGWGDRSEKDGPYVYYNDKGVLVRDHTPGPGGAHGPQHRFPVTIRDGEHPITRGMPTTWLASKDECYATLRGPAEQMTVLATCKDQTDKAPTDRHEPVMMAIEYGLGRVFHLTLGHDTEAFEGVGLIAALQRGAEWAATGEVTQAMPADFPTATKAVERDFGNGEWVDLLDAELSHWEEWTGGAPEIRTNNRADFTDIPPVGLGDPYDIFTIRTGEDGKPELAVSGELYAGLSSLKSYANYHFTAEFRWGEAIYMPRLGRKRDNGILYHCYGEHGAFWNVWKSCLEMQVQQTDMGDLFQLAGPNSITARNADGFWDPAGEPSRSQARIMRSQDAESPHGEWTRLDLYVVGDRAVHVVNGVVVMALWGAQDGSAAPLRAGHIQLQSEGAEAYYRDVRIRQIEAFPAEIEAAAGFGGK